MTKNERKQRKQEIEIQKKQEAKNGRYISRLISQSLFLHLLGLLTDTVYRWFACGLFGRMFTSYRANEKAFQNGAVHGYFDEHGSGFFRKVRKKLSGGFEGSYFLSKLKLFAAWLFEMPLRFYGTVILSFGIYSLVVLVILQFMAGTLIWDNASFLVSIVSIVAALPLYLSKESLGRALVRGNLTRALFVEAFGFREEEIDDRPKSFKKKANLGIIFGMAAGLMTAFIDAIYVVLIILLMIVAVLIFTLPEIGILLSVFMIPFYSFFKNPSLVLAALVLTTFFGYALKLVQGKRIFKLELVDGFVVGFAILIVMSGIISAGGAESLATALLSLCLMIGYFLVVNLIRTKKWVDRCLYALLSSGVITSVFGIIQFVFGSVDKNWLDTEYFSSIKGRAVSFFDNPNVLSAYLIIVFPIALSMLFEAKSFKGRFLAFISLSTVVSCLALTYSRAAWVAMVAVALVYGLINSRKTFKWLFCFGFALPLLPLVLPQSVRERLLSIGDMSESSNFYRVNMWRGTFNAIKEHFLGGVGFGTEAYEAVYPSYAYAGIESAEHSHNLYLQIIFAMGIFGFIVFAVTLFFFAQKNFEFYSFTESRALVPAASSAFCAVLGMLVIGLFDYPWYNYRVFFLFWIAMAISSATVRIGNRDAERQKMTYQSGEYNASIDI